MFENLELMETEMVIAASQAEEREKIITSLRESAGFAWRRILYFSGLPLTNI